MNSSVAVIFSHSPHGSSSGREGLDLILATLSFPKKIGLFFIGDGVLQLNVNQHTDHILSRNYISTFKVLDLYKISSYVCSASLDERGLKIENPLIIPVKIVSETKLRIILNEFKIIINF
ncbi:MAG: sulfurtransferase complex subunit TusC [Candidatus Dasytiphilus stammeri]